MKKEDYHIISIRDSKDFISTITEDLHAKDGIAVTTGKLKSKPEQLVTQEYYFEKDKWELEDAQKWVEDNGEVLDIMLDKPEGAKSMEPITKVYDCELKDFNEKERSFTAVASTEAVDRDGDILRVGGWKLGNYKKNPQGLWSHMAFMTPIFKTLALGVEDGKLKFVPQFVPKEIDPFADKIFQLYKNGFLKAFSVRFLPYKWETIQPKEAKPGSRTMYGRDYKSQELLEISACTVPANPECLANKSFQDVILTDKKLEYIGGIENEVKRKEMLAELNKDLGEIVEVDNEEMKPFENEHSCRVKEPGEYKTCRRTTRTTDGKKYSVITCQRKDDSAKWEEQAYRYPKDSWTEAEARKHCTDHDGIKFEPAAKKEINNGAGKENGLININVADIDKVKPLLDILKSGRVISEKNKKLITESITQLDKTSAALKGLLSITEPERSIDDIINEVKDDIKNEEVSKEEVERVMRAIDRVTKLMEGKRTVLNSSEGQEGK